MVDIADLKDDPTPWVPMSKPIDLKHLGKLGEECGELISAKDRCPIQGINEYEPITKKSNKEWLEDELADVRANSELVIEHFNLDQARIDQRTERKKFYLRRWHEMLK